MKELQEVSFNEVIASWLKDEWHYPFYDDKRNIVPERIIISPDLLNLGENKIRYDLLSANRIPILKNLPEDIRWFAVPFIKHDIERAFLITTSWCREISTGTFALKDALDNLHKKLYKINDITIECMESIKESATVEKISNTKLIFVASHLEGNMTVIEGNHRLIAMTSKALEIDKVDPIFNKVYVGISEKITPDSKFIKKM